MRKKDAKRLQKAINHANKLIHRLEQLEDAGVTEEGARHRVMIVRIQLLSIADRLNTPVDPAGMPK